MTSAKPQTAGRHWERPQRGLWSPDLLNISAPVDGLDAAIPLPEVLS